MSNRSVGQHLTALSTQVRSYRACKIELFINISSFLTKMFKKYYSGEFFGTGIV